jgi:hypothetical protein
MAVQVERNRSGIGQCQNPGCPLTGATATTQITESIIIVSLCTYCAEPNGHGKGFGPWPRYYFALPDPGQRPPEKEPEPALVAAESSAQDDDDNYPPFPAGLKL